MRVKYLAALIAVLLIAVCPSLAGAFLWPENTIDHSYADVTGPYAFDSVLAENQAIDKIAIIAEPGQSSTFTLQMNDGSTHSGSITTYTELGGTLKTVVYTLDGQTKTKRGLSIFNQDTFVIACAVAYNETSEEPQTYLSMVHTSGKLPNGLQYAAIDFSTAWLLDQVFGTDPEDGIMVELPETFSENPLVRIYGNAPNGIALLDVSTAAIEDIITEESSTSLKGQNIVSWAISKATAIYNIIVFLWSWIEFFFIENLMLTLLLIEGAILAYNMNTAPNIFVMFERTLQSNVKIFNFMVGAVKQIIELAGELISLINPMRYLTGK